VLYEESSETFFAAYWTRWRRMPEGVAGAKFDVDDDDAVAMISEEECVKMDNAFASALNITTMSKVGSVKSKADEPPPTLKAQRAQQKTAITKQQRAERKAEADRVREEGKAAAKAETERRKAASLAAAATVRAEAAKLRATMRGGKGGGARGRARGGARGSARSGARGGGDKAPGPALGKRKAGDELADAEEPDADPEEPDADPEEPAADPEEPGSPPLPPPKPQPSAPTMPPGWKAATDSAGRTYYYNKLLGQSQYQLPRSVPAQQSPPMAPPSANMYSAQPGSSSSASAGSLNHALMLQRAEQIARLRAQIPGAQGERKLELLGDLAALEMATAADASRHLFK
jgi:hypothetical protein